jgi:hypothetical protein
LRRHQRRLYVASRPDDGGAAGAADGPTRQRAIRHAIERIGVTVDLADLEGSVAVWRDGELRVRRPQP